MPVSIISYAFAPQKQSNGYRVWFAVMRVVRRDGCDSVDPDGLPMASMPTPLQQTL